MASVLGKYGSTDTDNLLAVRLRSYTMGTAFKDFKEGRTIVHEFSVHLLMAKGT